MTDMVITSPDKPMGLSFVVISDMFTLINGQAPSNVLAYEQQIALAVKILKSIKSSLNIYSEITLDRYYIYENNI